MGDTFAPGHDRVKSICRKLRPILGPQMDDIYKAFLLEDMAGRKQLEAYAEGLASKYLRSDIVVDSVDLVPPEPQHLRGDYPLGTVMYQDKPMAEFGLREKEWIQHVGVFGRSGAGKTNLGFELFRQLVIHDKPVLVFDWKRNYRDLLKREELSDVEVYTVGRNVAPFHFNPLIPPKGTAPQSWLKQLIEVIAHSYCLGDGVLFVLQETINDLYEEFGVYSGSVSKWPTMRDVLDQAKERNVKGREAAWMSSTLRALATLNFGEMSTLLNTSRSETSEIPQLLDRPVILEMDALSQADKIFLSSALLLFIHHHRMAEGHREVFKHACIIEEAHHLLSNERRSLIGGQSVMEITFREIREFGESIIALDQHPSKISLSALGNTYCTICLNLKHQKDISAMAQSMLLSGDEKDIMGGLEVGQAVVKLQGRAPKPFLIKIPEFSIRKGTFTDDDVIRRMAPILQARVVENSVDVETSESESSFGEIPNLESEKKRLLIALLRDVFDHPDSGIADRYRQLDISVRQGQRLCTRAAAEGYVEDEEIRDSSGKRRVLRLTEQGRQALEKKFSGQDLANLNVREAA